MFEEAPRTVHRDGHVEVAKACYSVPPEYLGRAVWARWDTGLVRVFNQRREVIALHARQDPGRFSTLDVHIHDHKRALVERGADYLLERAARLGPPAVQSRAMYQHRGVAGLRVLQGFLQFVDTHSLKAINTACTEALAQGAWRLRELRALLAPTGQQTALPFLEEHPVVRPLGAYAALVPACFGTPLAADPTAQS